LPELVIFDCDGVLVDSEPASNEVLAEMIGERGLRMTVAQARASFQGLLLKDVVARVNEQIDAPLPEGWIAEYEQRRSAAFRERLRPIPGAADLATALIASGVAVCVASQGRLAKTDLSLALTGLEQLFPPQVRFSAEQVPRGKPHPDLFLYAAQEMGSAPADCVVIEDTPSGVTAAVSAGIAVYGYCADSDEEALASAGARTVRSLPELERELLGAPT
jgi:HAD superfamily hydrolase (TIGR01509 family)